MRTIRDVRTIRIALFATCPLGRIDALDWHRDEKATDPGGSCYGQRMSAPVTGERGSAPVSGVPRPFQVSVAKFWVA